jgi:glycosyltransferase involved in cell wall biosynthesis
VRNSNLSRYKTKLSTRIVVWLCSKTSNVVPTKIVCCSHQAIKTHINCGYNKKKFYYIPNGFEVTKYKPNPFFQPRLKTDLQICNSKKLIGMIGRFDPQKNHLGYLECIKILNTKFDNLAYIFVGKSVNTTNFEITNLVEEYNLSKSIYLLGERSDIEFIMPALDILVSPSIYGEAFPNVIGEAMSCGVPCVVTDVGDSSAIVGSTGYVVSPDDNDSLSSAISNMLNLSRRDYNRLSKDARMRIKTNFDISCISKRYMKLYSKCIYNTLSE